ncbi:MAG: hypothetical protein Kow0047_23030 [Anaerolineae bacterium]
MPGLPAVMTRKLYQQGSLCNTDDGFEIVLTNPLAPGTVVGLGPIEVDSARFAAAQITVMSGRSVRDASRVTHRSPVEFPINGTIRLRVRGGQLDPGRHAIVVYLIFREIGPLVIRVEDDLHS